MPGFNIQISGDCHDENAWQVNSAFQGPAYNIETARSHRYALEILQPLSNSNGNLLLFLAKCSRPSAEIDEIKVHNGQDEIFRPGKQHWRPIEFTFYEVLKNTGDTSEDMAAKLIHEWWSENCVDIRNSRILPPDQFTSDAQLDMLDGAGNSVWTYDIYRSWPSKISPSDLDYSSSEIARISVTLKYDKAIERK